MTTQLTDLSLEEFVKGIELGWSGMMQCYYPNPISFQGLNIQATEGHILVNGVLRILRWEKMPRLESIKKYLQIAESFYAIKERSSYYSFFKESKKYRAIIRYGDPYKLEGFSEILTGTPSEIKERADELQDSMLHEMNRNGNPYVSIEIKGERYNKNLQKSMSDEWTASEATRRLRNGTTWIRNYQYADSLILWLLQNPDDLVKNYPGGIDNLQLKIMNSPSLSELWTGLVLAP